VQKTGPVIREAVLAAVQDGARTVAEVVRASGAHETSVRIYLRALRLDGLVRVAPATGGARGARYEVPPMQARKDTP
jgi:DNA-binding IclR family transcriptional regulator